MVLRRPPVESRPGFLAGLLQRLMPRKAQEQPYWLPSPETVQARPSPVQQVATAPAALPDYSPWAEIEEQVARERAIAEQIGPVSKRILESPEIVEGRWLR